MYKNQIEDDIIKSVLSDTEYAEHKMVAKIFDEFKSKKYKLELELTKKLSGRVIGKLENTGINYMAHGDEFYVTYESATNLKYKWYNPLTWCWRIV